MVTKVEKNPLKKVTDVENSIATTFDHFDPVIQSLDKATAITIHEIVQDFLHPPIQGLKEAIKAAQTTAFDRRDPASNLVSGATLGARG